ncbi:MAG: DNA polymerase III subunit epsilon, partial [Pseudomonadota bacterium]
KFPGAQSSLDALCRRYQIDNSNRTLHGALLDAELLAEVYLELGGGREPGLSLNPNQITATDKASAASADKPVRPARNHDVPVAELTAHRQAVATMKQALWTTIASDDYPSSEASSSS